MMINLAFRGYLSGVLLFEERKSLDAAALEEVLPALAEKHATLFATHKFTMEIEFLDEPDPAKRFFRFGTDTAGMREPLEIDLENPDEGLRKWKGR